MPNNQEVRLLGYRTSHTEACILAGTILSVLAIFGYSACYNVNHCPLISPYYDGNIIGKYIPTVSILAAGILLVLSGVFQKQSLFALATLASWCGVAGVIGMFISTIVEAGEFKTYIKPPIDLSDLSGFTNPNSAPYAPNVVGFVGPASKFWIWLAHVFIQGLFTILILVMGASYAWNGFKLLQGGGKTYSRPENIRPESLSPTQKFHQQPEIQVRSPSPQVRVETIEVSHTSRGHHHEQELRHEEMQHTKYDEVPI